MNDILVKAFLLSAIFAILDGWLLAADEPPMLGDPGASTSVVSNVQLTKAWKRTFVLGEAGGTLKDASGSIADYLAGQTAVESARYAADMAAAAHSGLTNALQRLYEVTNNIANFTGRVFIAGDLQADDTDRDNIWAFIAGEEYDNGEDVFSVWFSRDLGAPPDMVFRYRTEIGVEDAAGAWENWGETVTANGYEGCRRIRVTRPASVGRITMKTNTYPRFGMPGGSLDFKKRVFFIGDPSDASVTNLPWSGVWTNSQGVAYQWNNGVFMGEAAE